MTIVRAKERTRKPFELSTEVLGRMGLTRRDHLVALRTANSVDSGPFPLDLASHGSTSG